MDHDHGELGIIRTPASYDETPIARPSRRLAQLALAVAFLITAKVIRWRNQWSPG